MTLGGVKGLILEVPAVGGIDGGGVHDEVAERVSKGGEGEEMEDWGNAIDCGRGKTLLGAW